MSEIELLRAEVALLRQEISFQRREIDELKGRCAPYISPQFMPVPYWKQQVTCEVVG